MNLRGNGGIGKSILLQEFVKILNENKYPHSGIIDFYGIEMSSRVESVENRIVKKLTGSLQGGAFTEFRERQRQCNLDQKCLLELRPIFIEELSEWSKTASKFGKKVVLIFDSYEFVRYSMVGTHMLERWLPAIENGIVVISGRQKKEEIEFPKKLLGSIYDTPLEKFTDEESIEYLKARNVWVDIERSGVTDHLIKIINGRPLILALVADWISVYKIGEPKQLIEDEYKEGEGSKGFEKKLVEHLQIMGENRLENEILPAMAHAIRPFDKELVTFLKPDLSISEAHSVLENLESLSFIKKNIRSDGTEEYWFQDELRALFHTHIFSNPKWLSLRQDLSRLMIDFHERLGTESQKLDNEIAAQNSLAGKLYHEIFLDPKKGLEMFQDEFQGARDRNEYTKAAMLIGSVRHAVEYLDEEYELEKYMFQLAEGRWLRDMGDARRAKTRFQELLNSNIGKGNRTPYIFNGLGVSCLNLGEFGEALKQHKCSIELATKHRGKYPALEYLIALEKSNIGWVYRHMGRWEEAIQNLQDALAEFYEQRKKRDIADVFSKLGDVHGLKGDYEIGVDYCNKAIQRFEELRLTKKIAAVRSIRCDIFRRMGNYESAANDIEFALTETDAHDFANLASGHFRRGYVKWYQYIDMDDNKSEEGINLLKEALQDFEISIEISEKYQIYRELPKALHEVSEVYWELGKLDKARFSNRTAYENACAIHNYYYAVNCIVKEAEFDHREGKNDKVHRHAQKLENDFGAMGYHYPLFEGRLERILGDIELEKSRTEKAFQHYGKAIGLISIQGGYGRYSLGKELERLTEKINSLPNEEALRMCLKLMRYWNQNVKNPRKSLILQWIDDIIESYT